MYCTCIIFQSRLYCTIYCLFWQSHWLSCGATTYKQCTIPSLKWCTLWQVDMVHISPWFANFIDPNMSLNQIILIRKYFIKHFIAFYFCVAYGICRYLQFLALACFYFQGLEAIYTCFPRITDLFVCLFVCFFSYPYLLWNQSFFRQDSEYIKEVIKPFDWTFTTDYRGTLTGKNKMTMKVKTFFTLSLNIT